MNPRSLYLNGQWVTTDETLAVTNKASGETIGDVSTVDRARVAAALRDAQAAFHEWRSLTGKERGGYLRAVADELLSRKEEIARTITLENGKPIDQARGEVDVSADHLHWFGEEARRSYGRIIPHQAPGKRHLVIKSPVGVVGAISPWNFPLVLAVRKVAPAMAAGCPVVLKPASYTPLCAIMLAECMAAAKVPAGVFQLVLGSAREIGAEFIENPLCRKITFTGSTAVGQELIRAAAETVTPLSLELGGHAPVLVFSDADLDQAVEVVMIAKYRNSSQSCIAANRIYVQEAVYEEFLGRFVERTKALRTGCGLEPDTEIGPLIDEQAVETALEHIADATKRGARLLCGGTRVEELGGTFLAPTVLADVVDEALCMQEETFAPVAPVCSFQTEDEAVARANASTYGLAAYVCTRDLGRMFRLGDALEAGTVGFNDGAPSTSQCPFGGVKQSGWGRELGIEGMDAFLETKHLSIGGLFVPA